MPITDKHGSTFNLAAFLANAGLGRRIVELKNKENFYVQEIRRTPSIICSRAA